MKLLSRITPAETILITDSSSAQLKSLLKFTFMDLLLKKVIKIVEVSKKPHPRDQVRIYTYVEAGKNYSKYTPKNHELVFLNPFTEEESIQILFKHFVKMAYDNSKGSWNYKKVIRDHGNVNQYIKQSFFINLFRMIRLTDQGRKVQQDISAYLDTIDTQINDLLHNDKKRGLELLLNIGGNIFLLKNLDFELLKNIDKELLEQKKLLSDINYDSGYDSYYYIDSFHDGILFDNEFEDTNSFSSYFDDTMDSFDSEFDASSCSSCDSGCSSCGGCD